VATIGGPENEQLIGKQRHVFKENKLKNQGFDFWNVSRFQGFGILNTFQLYF